MPDQVNLSVWLVSREPSPLKVLAAILKRFPFSAPGRSGVVKVAAVDYTEPPVLEALIQEPDLDDILSRFREFSNPDVAYVIEYYWDLMSIDGPGHWSLKPEPARITCFEPEFPSLLGEQFLLELGNDQLFLPTATSAAALTAAKANIRSLVRLADDIRSAARGARVALWTESGDSLADLIAQSGLDGLAHN